MTPCPKCLGCLDEYPPLRPADMLVCQQCGVILRVADNWAIQPATPEEIDTLSPGRFSVVLETSMRVLARKLWRKNPLIEKHQQERKIWSQKLEKS